MKRIEYACIEQTIHFKCKEEAPKEIVQENMQYEVEAYLQGLRRRNIPFKVVDQILQADGSVVLKIKKQFNTYDCGDYLD